jgi:hypothetical protein
MKAFTRLAIALTVLLALAGIAGAQSWTPLNNQPPAATGPMLQLRDGRILVNESQGPDTGTWFILTPDAKGSYVNGTWSTTGHLPQGYAPIYFGSQILLDGRHVVIEGGEYNNGTAVWTTLGAYGTITPFGNVSWVSNSPPAGWGTIGDAQSVVLADGRYLQANCCTTQSAFFTGPNTWSANGNLAGVDNDEGAYTLQQNGKLLLVDAWSTGCSTSNSSELFDPTSNAWSCGPLTTAQLWDNSGHELGPNVVLHNGKNYQVGATNSSSVYNPVTNSWSAGPTPPNQLTGYDAPGALEPNGKVLEMMGPTGFGSGCQFLEYDHNTNTLANAPNPAGCPGDPSFVGHLMMLPSGQIMFTDFGASPVEVYTPASGVEAGARPTILAASTSLKIGSVNNVLWGQQLNGLSQNNAYGDDYQGDTNYPLVRLTCVSGNCTAGNVYYAFTHNESTHSIAANTIMFTKFDLPSTIPAGNYSLQSVASGVGSNSVIVSVK